MPGTPKLDEGGPPAWLRGLAADTAATTGCKKSGKT